MNKRLYVLPAVVALLFSCSEKEAYLPEVKQVLLVYLSGDNNLSGETYDKLRAITNGWNGDPDTRILIWHDTADNTPVLYELESDREGNKQKVIASYEEKNSADPVVFREALHEMTALYPGVPAGLLFFSHASGWLPEGALSNPREVSRSVGRDGCNEMELADLANAIPDGLFNFIVFEACHMAGIEVIWELKNKADYLFASSAEIVSPGFTHIYTDVINELLKGDLTGFGKAVYTHFETAAGFYRSATFSLIRTSGLDRLAAWVEERYDPEKEWDFTNIQSFDRTSYKLFFDFQDHYSRLAETESEKEELSRLIADCVVWKAATPDFLINYGGFAIRSHSGFTTYIPQSWFPGLNIAWQQTSWAQAIIAPDHSLRR